MEIDAQALIDAYVQEVARLTHRAVIAETRAAAAERALAENATEA